jgi:aspartate ammonia-lyase
MQAHVRNSIGLVTALSPYIGYENATAIAQEAHESGGSVLDLALKRKLLTKQQLEEILRPEVLTRPRSHIAISQDTPARKKPGRRGNKPVRTLKKSG